MTAPDLTSSDPLINRTIEGYHILKRLGEGTYGVVYLARHPRIRDRLVAVKYVRLERPDEIRNVEREVEVLARLQHPNVVDIYDTYRFDNYHLIVMELVRGGSLLEALQRLPRPLDLRTALTIIEQLAFALGYVHSQNILHLDLKPGNILLDPVAGGREARPLLTDFGIARIVNPGGLMSTNIVGTPMYMSPEHFGFGDNKPDHRSDVYSLGVILFELLTGHVPFRSRELLDVLNQHAYSPIPLPSAEVAGLPPDLDYIVLTALAKPPEERFQSANEMGSALRDLRLGPLGAVPALPGRMSAEVLGAIAQSSAEVMEAASAEYAAEAPPIFRLLVMRPDGAQESVGLHTNAVIIGRDSLANLRLEHTSISRRHARVDCDDNGNLFVTDLQSTNGTYLDGVRLTPQERVAWRAPQFLQIQGFLLQIDGPPGADRAVDPFLFTTAQVKVLLDELYRQRNKPGLRVNLSPDIVYLEPGKRQYVQVQVQPQNTPLARYEVRARPGPGLDDRWYALPAGHVISDGDSYAFDLVVSAPSAGTVGGRTHELALEVVSDQPEIPSVVQVLKLRIVPLTRYTIALQPNEVTHGRRRHADLAILNSSNYPESFSIDIEAPDTLQVTPEARQVQVEAAQGRQVRLKFRPARGAQKGRSRLLYTVIVHSASGLIERAHGSYVFQRRSRPSIGLLLALWVFLVIVISRHFLFGVTVQQQIEQVWQFLQSLAP